MTTSYAALTEEALIAAKMNLERKRANDPWDGPNGTARESQMPPDGDWGIWVIMAGRGFGKTRTGAEWIRKRVQHGKARRIVIAGPTAADIRDIMIEGESGLVAVCERAGVGLKYEPSKRRITFANGALGVLVSADEPSRFRGLQCDTFWADELASWRYADAWDQLLLGHRLSADPKGIVTTTPRPIPLVKDLLTMPEVVVRQGSTYENAANLSPQFKERVMRRYEGTTLGRQELHAEIIEDVEGALWKPSMFRYVAMPNDLPPLKRVVVAVDPATTYGPDSDETGIAVAALGSDGNIYVLHGGGYRESPSSWASRVVAFYETYKADEIVAETNQGGEMVRETLYNATRHLPITPVVRGVHAKDGKRVRADPVAALYEQGRVFHLGRFASLEDQMVTFPVANENDDQVDALVHAIVGVSPAMDAGVVVEDRRHRVESPRDRMRRHRRLER